MNKKSIRKQLIELGDYAITSGELIEDTLWQIEEILTQHPDGINLFLDMFENKKYERNKDIIALIIIQHHAHPDVISFLQNQEGWSKEDFEGTAAESFFKDK